MKDLSCERFEMIPVNDLKSGYIRYQEEYEKKAIEVLRGGWYILGKELESFECEWAEYNHLKFGIGVASGLDAISIALHCLDIGPGDEVIVQANTFIASVMGITANGATPVFVEPDEYYGIDADRIEEKITPKTKAVMVVHLYGIPCDMDKILDICVRHNLKLIEDCAQSHGATYNGKMTGSFSDAGCFSFYPTKNLGAFGDGGCIVTDNEELAEECRIYRNYGSKKHYHNEVVGVNSRLDEIQAGLLRIKLSHMDEIMAERRDISDRYKSKIQNPHIILPKERPNTKCVWHQYVIRCDYRNKLMDYLKDKGIGTLIHYPIPPHLSKAYEYLGYKQGDFPITEKYADTVLSIPMYNGLEKSDQDKVIEAINAFKP